MSSESLSISVYAIEINRQLHALQLPKCLQKSKNEMQGFNCCHKGAYKTRAAVHKTTS